MPAGRPREFDVDQALDQALETFWRKGYEGASLSDLTEAMGINRPSLYAAFGNKEELFRRALERYTTGPAAYVCEALNEPTARAVVERLLFGAVDMQSDPGRPRGCLAVHGALAAGDDCDVVRRELVAYRQQGEDALRERLERAQQEGDLPGDVNAGDLARFYVAVIRGMAVQSTGGATPEELRSVADLALRAWPG